MTAPAIERAPGISWVRLDQENDAMARIEQWFIGGEPMGECEHGDGPAAAVVDGRRFVCEGHVGEAVSEVAEQHGTGYLISVEYTEPPRVLRGDQRAVGEQP